MFRKMRNKKKAISQGCTKQMLGNALRGVLTVNGDNDYPYAVPVNFLYDEEKNCIYFHSLRGGYKVECLNRCDKVCFTVYGNEQIKEEAWAPFVQSVVVFGRCHPTEDKETMLEMLKNLALKYYPNEELVHREITATGHAVQMFEIEIEYLIGKEIQEK